MCMEILTLQFVPFFNIAVAVTSHAFETPGERSGRMSCQWPPWHAPIHIVEHQQKSSDVKPDSFAQVDLRIRTEVEYVANNRKILQHFPTLSHYMYRKCRQQIFLCSYVRSCPRLFKPTYSLPSFILARSVGRQTLFIDGDGIDRNARNAAVSVRPSGRSDGRAASQHMKRSAS